MVTRTLEREAHLQLAILRSKLQPVDRKPIDRELAVTQPSEFSRVFETYHGMIFRTAYRITGNSADAEDVLQTIFLRLLRQSPTAQVLSKEESYLRRAAINASLDLLRARRSNPALPLSDATIEGVRPVASESHGSELKDLLRRAFANLSPRSAEIFALRYFEDFSNRQIAEALHMSHVLVAVTLHRTRRQLQKEIRSCIGVQNEPA